MPSTSETLIGRTGALGRIRLSRPKALNSLTLAMVRDIEKALEPFQGPGGISLPAAIWLVEAV